MAPFEQSTIAPSLLQAISISNSAISQSQHLAAFNEIKARFMDPALPPEISGKWHQQPQVRTELSVLSPPALLFSSGHKMFSLGTARLANKIL